MAEITTPIASFDGTMPCDGPWPADDVAKFANWMSSGGQP